MHIQIKRDQFSESSTIGRLLVDGVFRCFTLEDRVREVPGEPVEKWKLKGETAIPAGSYACTVTFSNRFKKPLPLLHDVPGFTGVRIHSGNTDADTEGCILVGLTARPDWIGNSRDAFVPLLKDIQATLAAGQDVLVEIA